MVTELIARDLAFAYEDEAVVRGIDLKLESGELVCVIGPNGAGKTTLLKLLAGVLEPDQGEVEVEGRALGSMPAKDRAVRIAVVPQALTRVPEVRVRDFVLGGRYAHLDRWRRSGAKDLEVVERSLEQADLRDLSDRILTQLSGGQLQRALIARALAQEARVLLVDEPTSSLDPEHQLIVFDLIARLTCEGRACLVVTHDMNLASQYATRIAVLANGRVAAQGTPAEALTSEVLKPVYGERLRFGAWEADGEERPFVLPWGRGGLPD